MNGSCFMEPTLEMSTTSTLKDLTEASVGKMVSGYTIALKGGGVSNESDSYDGARTVISQISLRALSVVRNP